MTSRSASLLAWSLCILSIGLALLGLFFLFSSLDVPVENRWGVRGFPALFVLGLSVVGALVASRQPTNPIGWIFCITGLLNSFQLLGEEYAVYAALDIGSSSPGRIAIVWLADWIWVPTVGLLATFFLLLFPSGRLSSPRWRPVAWLSAIAIGLASFGFATVPGPLESTTSVTNPFGINVDVSEVLVALGGSLLIAAMFLSASSLVLRLRSSEGEEREQLKWLAYAGSLGAFAMAAILFVSSEGTDTLLADALEVLAIASFLGIIAATGIAIVKYRLYDIDLIINRSLVYGP